MAETDGRLPSEMVPFQTVQIIAAALIVGPLIFAGIAYGATIGQPPGDPVLGYIAVGFSAMALVMSFVIPSVVTSQKLRALGPGAAIPTIEFFAAYQTRVIVRSALLEGAVFFCCIAYMSTRLWWTLAAGFVLLAVMAFFFPTRGRFDDWVRQQRELGAFDAPADSSRGM